MVSLAARLNGIPKWFRPVLSLVTRSIICRYNAQKFPNPGWSEAGYIYIFPWHGYAPVIFKRAIICPYFLIVRLFSYEKLKREKEISWLQKLLLLHTLIMEYTMKSNRLFLTYFCKSSAITLNHEYQCFIPLIVRIMWKTFRRHVETHQKDIIWKLTKYLYNIKL